MTNHRDAAANSLGEATRARGASGRNGAVLDMSDDEFALFRGWVATHCAIDLGDDKKYLLESRLAPLVTERGCRSFGEFFPTIARTDDARLRDRVIDAVTTHETMWFRDEHCWTALRDAVLPSLLAHAARRGSPPRIWSAACSTGQEPYSLAMLVDAHCAANPSCGVRPESVDIVASDISVPALVLATAGRYDARTMQRGMSGQWSEFRNRYFVQRGAVSEISADLRRRVRFVQHNLQDSMRPLGKFDLVLMRYVAIYFSRRFTGELWRRVRDTLNPDGCLVLGASESSMDSGQFEAEHHERSFYRPTSPQQPP